LREQSLADELYEVIVVDDGSTDDTSEVISGLDLPPAYKYFKQPHGGSGKARNRGAEVARGEIVLFFDDDVVATPRLLEAHVRAHNRWGRVAVLGYTPFAADLTDTPVMDYHRARWGQIFSDVEAHETLSQSVPFNYFITLNLSVSLGAFRQIGPFDASLFNVYEDTELGLRFAQAGVPLRFSRDALAWHRPQLDASSLTTRQEGFGYRAGCYYLTHPNNIAMNECMRIAYVLGKSGQSIWSRLRARARRVVLNDTTAKRLLRLAESDLIRIPSICRRYCLRLVVGHYYARGFWRAIREANVSNAGRTSRTGI
jgi:GT2 family glycosyltransferase